MHVSKVVFVFKILFFQLFDVVKREETLLNVINSVTRNGPTVFSSPMHKANVILFCTCTTILKNYRYCFLLFFNFFGPNVKIFITCKSVSQFTLSKLCHKYIFQINEYTEFASLFAIKITLSKNYMNNCRNLRSILLTFFFAVILVYIFSIFGYVLFQGKNFSQCRLCFFIYWRTGLRKTIILFSDDFLMETTPLQAYKRNAPFWTR
jgi:hypothetical protein